MKCHLYANGELVGWAELIHTDPSMGYVSGPFYPNESYKKIQPVIREHHLCDGTLGEKDEKRLKEVQAHISALRMVAITENGEVLDPIAGVHIVDFSEELPEEPYLLEILGLSHEVFARLFPVATQDYYNHSWTKDVS